MPRPYPVIGVDTFGSVFGGQPAHTAEHMTEHLRAVIRAGYSPVLCKPGGKETACILSAAQAKKADREFQQRLLAANPAARVNGRTHECGFKHVLDDPAKVGPIVTRFMERHGGLNIALHLGRSRMLVVDVDTPMEREAFIRSWEEAVQLGPVPAAQVFRGITVESPGSYDQAKQEWVHWGGGHWWMPLPEGFELPAGKVFKGPGGWAAMYGESYALVPPAARPEGAYRLVGGTTSPPEWLLQQVTEAGAAREQVQRERQASAGGPIDAWSAATSWGDLLGSRGWLETSLVEGSCGCPVWTAPGAHSSPKSATAHDLGCARFDTAEGWGPLKIWTDNPPDGLPPEGAVTKLQFVAAVDHGGDDGAAIRALGIERAPVASAFAVPEGWERPMPGAVLTGLDSPGDHGGALVGVDDFATPTGPAPDPSSPQTSPAESGEPAPSWAPIDLTPFLDGSYVEPPATLMPRSDGVCLLYPGLVHSLHGESESGKSWIVQAEAARVIRSGGSVIYVDFESGPGPVIGRILALGARPGDVGRLLRYIRPETRPTTLEEYGAFLAMFAGPATLAVIDGVTDAMGIWGLKTTDNDEYSSFAKAFPRRLATETGAAVVLVDHVTKDKDSRGRFAIGGQAKMATLDGAAYVVDVVEHLAKGVRGVLSIGIGKDRPGGVRAHGGAMNGSRVQPIAEFILDSTGWPGSLLAGLVPPTVVDPNEFMDSRAAAVLDYVGRYPGQSQSVIARETGLRPADTIAVLRALESEGKLVIEKIGQKHTHTLTSPLFAAPSSTPSVDVVVQNGQQNPYVLG